MKHQIGQKVYYNGQLYEVVGPSKNSVYTKISRIYRQGEYNYGSALQDAYDEYLLTEVEYEEKTSSFEDALKTAKAKMEEALAAVSLLKELGRNGVGDADVLSDIATDIAEQCGVEWNSSNC